VADTQSTGGRRFGLALELLIALTGVVTVIANVALTNRSLDLTEQAQEEQRQIVMVTPTLAGWSAKPDPEQPGQTVITIDYVLQNVGDKPVRGCGTHHEPVAADMTPIKYWPSIMEPGGILWNLEPGGTHETTDDLKFDRVNEGDSMIVELWFECVYPKLVTESVFLRLDLVASGVDVANDLNRVKRLDSYDRYSIIERADGRTPQPRPN
jgi:hypothetical protein